MKTVITMLVVAIVAAAAGIAVYALVIAPKLSGKEPPAPPKDKIPLTAKNIDFGEDIITLPQTDKNVPASMLLYNVSLKCSHEEAVKLIEDDKAYFKEMIANLHRSKTRAELDDPVVMENIKKEALKKANQRLEKLQVEPKEEIKVLEVSYSKFTVVDQ
jgi:flagellar basal body-associated protein FliL